MAQPTSPAPPSPTVTRTFTAARSRSPSSSRRRVAWHVVDAYLDFVEDKSEWTGTDITFDITPARGGSEVRFTHVGLAPGVECFDSCSNAWGFYITGSLRNLIAGGQGEPNLRESAAER